MKFQFSKFRLNAILSEFKIYWLVINQWLTPKIFIYSYLLIFFELTFKEEIGIVLSVQRFE